MNAWQMSPMVSEWMSRHIPSRAVVLELGGGTGSLALHSRWNTTTVEHDERWTAYLRRTGLATHHAPIVDGWYELTPELERLLRTADVVIIDGPPGALRTNAAPYLDHIKPGAFVIFDDTNRAKVLRMVTYPIVTVITDGTRSTHITKKPCPTAQDTKPDQLG